MHITLIGMSNIGKSHWAKRLAAESGFTRIDCDKLIEDRLVQQLGPELKQMGLGGIEGVARWMGQPYEAQYSATSRDYIKCERAVMQEAIELLRSGKAEKPLVIDTSGSVIYMGDDITDALRELTRVIYLAATPAHSEKLFARYIAEPKPVIWGDAFSPQAGEDGRDALKRCYPQLLDARARLYEKMAHVTYAYEQHRDDGAVTNLFQKAG